MNHIAAEINGEWFAIAEISLSYARIVLWGSNKDIHFWWKALGELHKSCNWFIVKYVGWLSQPSLVKKKKKKHLITFTNDYSLKTWISFFLFFTEKLKFFSIFKRFNMHLEKTTYSQHYGVTNWKNVNHYSQYPICKEHAINVLARSSKLSSTCLESQPIIGSER